MTTKRRRPLSLALRLTLLISVTTIIAFIVFSSVVIYSVKQHFEEQDLNELQQVSTSIQQVLRQNGETTNDQAEQELINKLIKATSGHNNIFISVSNRQQQVIYQTPSGPELNKITQDIPATAQLDINKLTTWYGESTPSAAHMQHPSMTSSTSYRIAVLSINTAEQHYTLVIALAIDFHLHYIQSLTQNLSLIALIACVIIVLIARLAIYQGHAPLRKVSKKIQSISSDNLHIRLQPNAVPIELEQLVIAFNTMIERIEEVFKRQSHFSADIAHEIRTPITNLVTQTHFVLNQPRSVSDYQDILYSNLEEYERLTKMVSDMLFLAQADNKLLIPELTAINLNKELTEIFDYFEAWAEERGVSLQLAGEIPVIYGDRLMLRRVFNNLLSNAIRYTPSGESVTVHLTEQLQQIEICVENPGPTIPNEHLSKLFDRFYRVDPSRHQKGGGSGIGLAIVKSIITAHRGTISVSSQNNSTKFTIILPK